MTINYARENVIDFTKPFMNLGIGILFKVSLLSRHVPEKSVYKLLCKKIAKVTRGKDVNKIEMTNI